MRAPIWYRRPELGDVPRRADLAVRWGGLSLLALSATAANVLYLMDGHKRMAGVTPGEAGVGLIAVVLLSAGLMLVIEGAQLFRLQPMPPRSWVPIRGTHK